MLPRSKTLTVGLSFVGAVVGAGFISGQELAQFFLRFGYWGLLGWLVVAFTTILVGSRSLQRFAVTKPDSYNTLTTKWFGQRMGRVAEVVFNGYLIGGLVIMLSGAGCLLADVLHWPLILGVLPISLGIVLIIVGRVERLLRVNKILIPVLIGLTTLVAVRLLLSQDRFFDVTKTFEIKSPSRLMPAWWLSVLLYLGYNAIGAIVSFVSMAREVSSEEGRVGGLIGGSIVAALGLLLLTALWVTYPLWQTADLPLVHVIRVINAGLYPLFVPSMLIAMFSVATTYALGLSKYLEQKLPVNYTVICVVLVVVLTPPALLGFSTLLGTIYPFFGILATLLLLWLVVKRIPGWLVAKSREVSRVATLQTKR